MFKKFKKLLRRIRKNQVDVGFVMALILSILLIFAMAAA